MAVHMVKEMERYVELEMQEFVLDTVVPAAKEAAPHDTGNLKQHIYAYQTSKFRWIVTTNSHGENGVAYPARIELGQAVYPTNKPALWFHKKWHSMARASSESHFMKNTVSRFGGH